MNSFQPYVALQRATFSQISEASKFPFGQSPITQPQNPMELLRTLFAVSASLTAFATLRADEDAPAHYRGWEWISHYYQNPRPNDLVPAVYSLSRSGYFES